MGSSKKRKGRRAAAAALSAAMVLSILPPGFAGSSLEAYAADGISASEPIVYQSSMNYGGANTDSYKSVAFTKDGGFVAAGYSLGKADIDGWDHNASGTSYASNDGIVVKYNAKHQIEWAKNYGYNGGDTLFGVDVLNDGTIVAAGQSAYKGTDSHVKGVSGWILIINPEDPEDYKEIYLGGTLGDYIQGIVATQDGNFAIAGYSASKNGYAVSSDGTVQSLWEAANGTDDAVPNRINASGSEGIIAKFDEDGGLVFSNVSNYAKDMGIPVGTFKTSRFYGLGEDNDGNLIAVGVLNQVSYISNSQIVKFDGKTGSQIWGRSVGSSLTEAPSEFADRYNSEYNGVTVLENGDYLITGYTKGGEATTEEGWDCVGTKDAVLGRYTSDGTFLFAENMGTIDDSTDYTGAFATDDGGYVVYGSAPALIEQYEIDKGYDWDNYGAYDAIMIKFDENNKIQWAQNYGTESGDYINDVAVSDAGEVLAVGESNGSNGTPTWGNNGLYDGIVIDSLEYPDANAEAEKEDGDTVWADGTYEDYGTGYGGRITVKVTIADHKISAAEEVSQNETKAFYEDAKELYETIPKANSADVDSISGSTLSSNGIKQAVRKCLSQASAKTVTDLIDAIGTVTKDSSDAVKAARAAYNELGTYARTYVSNYATLTAAESALSFLSDTADTESSAAESSLLEDESASSSGSASAGTGENIPNDTYAQYQDSYLSQINWNAFRNRGITGKGVTIALIDSGLTPGQQDLDYNHILPGYDFTTDSATMTDTSGHGTAVAGVIAAVANNNKGVAGLLSEVDLLPLRVDTKSETVAKAINYAVEQGAQIIATSLEVKNADDTLKSAVENAAAKDVILIAAAGNSSKADSAGNDAYVYPAAYDEFIGVGAVNADGTVRSSSQKNDSVYVTAPGSDIIVLDISRRAKCTYKSGTSFSSPIVSAMAAAAKSLNPNMTADDFRTLLQTTSNDAGAEGYDTTYGYGIVDLEKFAAAIVPAEGITLNQDTANLTVGGTLKLEASLTPENTTQNTIVWSSNNDSVASVEDGTITAKASGTAVITAAIDGTELSASCEVKVSPRRSSGSGTGRNTSENTNATDDTPEEPSTVTVDQFTDVDTNAYYYDALNWAVENGITVGTTATTFSPKTATTRGQMVQFLYRMAGSPDVDGSILFSDVPENTYYYRALIWAYQNGITAGTTETTFSPNDECTRGQMAQFLYNYYEKTSGNTPEVTVENPFTDASESAYYYTAVRWAYQNGVTAGLTSDTYGPDSSCTRGQMVQFLYSLSQVK